MMILFKNIYHKEQAHMSPIHYKFQGLQGELISWRPREPKVELQSERWQDWDPGWTLVLFQLWRQKKADVKAEKSLKAVNRRN